MTRVQAGGGSTKRLSGRAKATRSASLSALLADEAGLTTVEYIIILCLIAVVGFAIWKQFGQTVDHKAKGATNVVQGLPTTSAE